MSNLSLRDTTTRVGDLGDLEIKLISRSGREREGRF
jgi:hypothetical protein